MMQYRLSNTQIKELRERAVTLTIAIPLPPYEVNDLVDHARQALPGVARHVRVAELQELTVHVQTAPPPTRDTLSDLIGVIVRDERAIPDDWLTVQVLAIVVTLDPLQPSRAAANSNGRQ